MTLAVSRRTGRSPARRRSSRGIVYFSTLKRRTYALDARTGKLVWTFPDGKYSPVVADAERLYLVGYAPASTAWSSGANLRDALRRHRRRRASSARTSPSALVAAGHEVVGVDCFTDYYDPALKEENARGPRRARGSTSPRTTLDLDGVDGVFHLAGQPGVRSFGDVFPLYLRRNVLATQRVFEAAARRGVRVVFASSSSVYGDAERYPDARRTPTAADLAVRDHEARVRAPRARVRGRASGSTPSCSATSPSTARASGPTWLRAASCDALAGGRDRSSSTATATQSRSFTYVARRRRRDDRSRWSARRPAAIYNVGGGDEASMLRGDRAARGDLRPARSTCGASTPRRATSRRTKADIDAHPRRARLGAATPLEDGLRRCGRGPR